MGRVEGVFFRERFVKDREFLGNWRRQVPASGPHHVTNLGRLGGRGRGRDNLVLVLVLVLVDMREVGRVPGFIIYIPRGARGRRRGTPRRAGSADPEVVVLVFVFASWIPTHTVLRRF